MTDLEEEYAERQVQAVENLQEAIEASLGEISKALENIAGMLEAIQMRMK